MFFGHNVWTQFFLFETRKKLCKGIHTCAPKSKKHRSLIGLQEKIQRERERVRERERKREKERERERKRERERESV